MIRQTCVLGIRAYQQYLSPHKGFCCAHRVLHGELSCSESIKRLILDKGLFAAWGDIRKRFADCKEAAGLLRLRRQLAWATAGSEADRGKRRNHWADACDCGAAGCDAGNCDGAGCDGVDCGGCDCSF